MNELNEKMLGEANAEALHAHLCDPAVTLGEGRRALLWLQLNHPDVANDVLCRFYDVACYRVGDVYPNREDIPKADLDMWFASTSVESHLPAASIPLVSSEAGVRAAAVLHLQLDKLFLGNDSRISGEFDFRSTPTGSVPGEFVCRGTSTGRWSSRDMLESARPKSGTPAVAHY